MILVVFEERAGCNLRHNMFWFLIPRQEGMLAILSCIADQLVITRLAICLNHWTVF